MSKEFISKSIWIIAGIALICAMLAVSDIDAGAQSAPPGCEVDGDIVRCPAYQMFMPFVAAGEVVTGDTRWPME